jgi:hypothetical protein
MSGLWISVAVNLGMVLVFLVAAVAMTIGLLGMH